MEDLNQVDLSHLESIQEEEDLISLDQEDRCLLEVVEDLKSQNVHQVMEEE